MSDAYAYAARWATTGWNTYTVMPSCSFLGRRPSSIPTVFRRKRLSSRFPANVYAALPSESVSAGSVPVESVSPQNPLVEITSADIVPTKSASSVASFTPEPGTLSFALRELFGEGERKRTIQEIMRGILEATVEWNNPLFSAASFDDVISSLVSLLNFVLDPRILIINERQTGSTSTEIEWLFSFVYPLPWRPRVSIGGRTVTERGTAGIVSIKDTWNGPPWYILRQSMLRYQDLIWLWPSPHAEVDVGIRKMERKTKDYSVVVFPQHPEFRVRGEIKNNERYAIWSTPALPKYAYVGNIRRLEAYDAVSPIAVRKIQGNEFEWAVSLPGTFFGTDLSTLQHPEAAAEFAMIPERRLAVVRFGGFATAKVFLAKRDELLDALVRDGLIDKDCAEDESRVWSRLYDCKLGFNSSGMPTLATYGYARLIPRVNEIAVELDREVR